MNTSIRLYDDGHPAETWDGDTGWYDAWTDDGTCTDHRPLTPDENAILNPAPVDEGPAGQPRWTGEGQPPSVIPGAAPGDAYLDVTTGDIYILE